MTDLAKSDEQIAKEKAAVDAMKGAQANMTKALDRISTLERALSTASSNISRLKSYIAPGAYTYDSTNRKTCTSEADDAIAAIAKVLS